MKTELERQDIQFTEQEAVYFSESCLYEKMTSGEIFDFQMHQQLLCMPFSVFHKATEDVLKRPVYTHEFAFHKGLIREAIRGVAATVEDVVNKIPAGKQTIIVTTD